MKVIDKIALVLIIIGAINWGLIGLFGFDTLLVPVLAEPVAYTSPNS